MTALEYLISKISSKTYGEYWSNQQDITEYVEEALRMEKQQIIDAWENGQDSFSSRNAEQYYQETFVSKGSYVNGDILTKDSVIVELPQQEISDEKIEKASANLANPNADKTDNWIEGAKWYREQLKQRQ